jgi:hypothetical protein
MRKEWLARSIVLVFVAAAIAFPMLGWQVRSRGIVIHARMAETGGWTPESLTVEVGKPCEENPISLDLATRISGTW